MNRRLFTALTAGSASRRRSIETNAPTYTGGVTGTIGLYKYFVVFAVVTLSLGLTMSAHSANGSNGQNGNGDGAPTIHNQTPLSGGNGGDGSSGGSGGIGGIGALVTSGGQSTNVS